MTESKSQLGQDLFVLAELDNKRGGYFVEFGATDGLTLSNTYMLEKGYGWTGILAEPATVWHEVLRKNRQCIIDTRCVWKASGQTLMFNETKTEGAEYSTLVECNERDHLFRVRKDGTIYPVVTVSLMDLLKEHEAPKIIDYLSLDTEGSEIDILEAIDFDAYDIRIVTVEHNYTAARSAIRSLLGKNGYTRVHADISKWDDWYVKA